MPLPPSVHAVTGCRWRGGGDLSGCGWVATDRLVVDRIVTVLNADTYARRYRVNYVDDGYDTIDYDPYGATGLLHTKRGQPSFVLATNKRLITDECCTKPCYVAELRTYCSG